MAYFHRGSLTSQGAIDDMLPDTEADGLELESPRTFEVMLNPWAPNTWVCPLGDGSGQMRGSSHVYSVCCADAQPR